MLGERYDDVPDVEPSGGKSVPLPEPLKGIRHGGAVDLCGRGLRWLLVTSGGRGGA
jgi:hypothetical protein